MTPSTLIEELCQRVAELEGKAGRAQEIRGALSDRLESVENDLARFERRGDTLEDKHLVDRMGLLASECARLRERIGMLSDRLESVENRVTVLETPYERRDQAR